MRLERGTDVEGGAPNPRCPAPTSGQFKALRKTVASCPPLLSHRFCLRSLRSALRAADGARPPTGKRKCLRMHRQGSGHVGELAITAQARSGWFFLKNSQDGKCCSLALGANLSRAIRALDARCRPWSGRGATAASSRPPGPSERGRGAGLMGVGTGKACTASMAQPSPRSPDPCVPPLDGPEVACPRELSYTGAPPVSRREPRAW